MNTPYRKEYDSQGLLLNKITKNNPYLHHGPNRRERRMTARANSGQTNNRRVCPIVVIGTNAYYRVVQWVAPHYAKNKKGVVEMVSDWKRIVHHIPKTKI